MVTTTEGLEVEYGITLNKLTQQLAKAEARMAKAATQAENRFGRANKSIQRGFANTNRAVGNMGGGLRNASLQFSQIIQQGQATGDFFKAAAIQAADFTAFMGPLGVALGAVGGGLATMALNMMDAGDETNALEEAAKDLTDALNDYMKAAELASLPTAELEERYGRATDAARTFILALKDIDEARARRAASTNFELQAGQLGEFDIDIGKPIEDLTKARAALQEEIARLAQASFDAVDTAAALELDKQREALERNAVDLEKYADSVRDLARDYDLTTEEAERLAKAINDVFIAEGLDEEVAAAQNLQTTMVEIFKTIEAMPTPMQEFFRSIADSGEKAAKLQGNTEGAHGAIQDLASAASATISIMSALSGEAGVLRDNLADAAANLSDYLGNVGAARRQRLEESTVAAMERRKMISDEDLLFSQSTDGLSPDKQSQIRKRASRSGGKGSKNEPFFQAAEETLTSLERQVELLGKSTEEVATLTAKYEMLDEAQRRGITVTDSLRAQIDAQAAAIGKATAELERMTQQMEFIESLEDGFLSSLVSDIAAGTSAVDALANAFSRLALQIAEAYFQKLLFNRGPFTQGSGNGIAGGLLGGLLGFQRGGYTGTGSPNEVKGVVHAGEYVFNRDQVREIGRSNLEDIAMGRSMRMQGAAEQIGGPARRGGDMVSVEAPDVHVRAIVVDDPSQREAALFQSPRFEREVLAVMNRNR